MDTFNYAPLAVLVVIALAVGTWFAAGRKHFMRDVPAGHDTLPADELLSSPDAPTEPE